ncbi:nucleoside phosphorylase domain-containing protein [Aspergillus oleicola]
MAESQLFDFERYRVGIICALDRELRAVRCILDSIYPTPLRFRRDTNTYIVGTICGHDVVVTSLPAGQYGTSAAASVASQLRMTFHAVEFCLLVGVAGGVPGKHDIHLGDVVVGHETGYLHGPPRILLEAINNLKLGLDATRMRFQEHLHELTQRHPIFGFPGRDCDFLFPADCVHEDAEQSEYLYVHYGLVASRNKLTRDAALRDRLSEKYNILCFEMEAAGVVNAVPCLVIRGICDYSDSHKNKLWQDYAAKLDLRPSEDILCKFLSYASVHQLWNPTLADAVCLMVTWRNVEALLCS